MDIIFYPLCAFIIVAVMLPRACKLAISKGLTDKPGGRKKHDHEIPLVGGVVVFFAFILASVVFCAVHDFLAMDYLWFLVSLLLLLVTGALDDKNNISARIRFIIQFVAAIILVFLAGAQLKHLGDLFGFGLFWLGWMSIPFSVIAAVLLINAINLIDGLDGLCAGNGFIVAGWLALWCVWAQETHYVLLLCVLMAALAGFLVYNLRTPWCSKASVFLGDAGSLALGLSIAWFTMSLGGGKEPVIEPISVAWMLAWPIFDICGQFARRIKEGRHPFDPDHDHFHHHFVNLGIAPGRAVAIILLIAFATGAIGVLGVRIGIPLPVLTWGWIVLLLAHIYLSIKPERYRALIGKVLRCDG